MNIMVQGTTSSAGKSLLCTALCQIFKEDGFSVYPFKSQNMSSSIYKARNGDIISTAQALQGVAADKEPDGKMNPILLKPSSDKGSDIYLLGKKDKSMEAREYYIYKNSLKDMIIDIYNEVSYANDIVVIEGAGSPAEINLNSNDFVNMGLAEIADSPVILVADIERGGVFASLYGTVKLLEEKHRDRIKGLVINKFRGDIDILKPGLYQIEDMLNIPVLGVIPYIDSNLSDEEYLINKYKNLEEGEELEELKELSKFYRKYLDMEYIYHVIGVDDH